MTETIHVAAESTRHRTGAALGVAVVAGIALAACSPEASNDSPEAAPSSSQYISTPATATTSETPTVSTPTHPATPNPTHSVQPTPREGIAGCAPYFDTEKYREHQYEVCTAYVANSAEIALQGAYKYGNNRVGYLATPAMHHFETRYWLEPRKNIEQRIAAWPQTSALRGNRVEQSVTVLSVTSDHSADRGVVQTRESWRVTSSDGRELYNEPLHTQEVTMCRGKLPGHPLHLWVVVSYSSQPHFDCIGFDQSNGLEP